MGGELVALFPKLKQLAATLVLSAGLAACVASPGAQSGKAAGPNPVTGEAIEVTALDAGPVAKPEKPAAAKPAPDAAPTPAVDPGQKPKPRPDTKPEAEAEASPPMPEAAPPVPQAQKTAAQIACEKRGNIWSKAGKSEAYTCVKRLGDGGKRCTKGDQCQGECLARSNTCAPMTPLFGCNEVLQDNGSRVTLCID